MKRFYYDTEAEKVVSLGELKRDFDQFKAEAPEEFNYDFADYMENCLSKNGSLCELSAVLARKMRELKALFGDWLDETDAEIQWRIDEIREIQRYIEMN